MPTRQFCDLCDERIEDGEYLFSTSITVVYNGSNPNSAKELLIDSNYVDPETSGSLSMVCQNCTRRIMATIISLNREQHS